MKMSCQNMDNANIGGTKMAGGCANTCADMLADSCAALVSNLLNELLTQNKFCAKRQLTSTKAEVDGRCCEKTNIVKADGVEECCEGDSKPNKDKKKCVCPEEVADPKRLLQAMRGLGEAPDPDSDGRCCKPDDKNAEGKCCVPPETIAVSNTDPDAKVCCTPEKSISKQVFPDGRQLIDGEPSTTGGSSSIRDECCKGDTIPNTEKTQCVCPEKAADPVPGGEERRFLQAMRRLEAPDPDSDGRCCEIDDKNAEGQCCEPGMKPSPQDANQCKKVCTKDNPQVTERKLEEVAECDYPTDSFCQKKCECRRHGGTWDDEEEKCKKCGGGGDGRLLEGEDECEDEDDHEDEDEDDHEDEDENDDNDDNDDGDDADDDPGADDVCDPADVNPSANPDGFGEAPDEVNPDEAGDAGEDTGDLGEDMADDLVESCFRRDSVALVPAAISLAVGIGADGNELLAAAQKRKMVDLRGGDEVLAVDPHTGKVFVDRVSFNLHLHNERSDNRGVTLHLDGGSSVSVTDHHSMLMASHRTMKSVPAHQLKVGDQIPVTRTNTAGAHIENIETTVLPIIRVERWRGGIINPLTHSGLILVASSSGESVITTTVLHATHSLQRTLIALPVTALKLASWLFPAKFQQSELIQGAILTGCKTTVALDRVMELVLKEHTPVAMYAVLQVVSYLLSILAFVLVELAAGCFLLAQVPPFAAGATVCLVVAVSTFSKKASL